MPLFRERSVTMLRAKRPDWLVPAGLIALSLIPITFGAVRLTELAGGTEITPDNARFFASPVPVVTHVISVTIYCILGPVLGVMFI